jgi:dihydrofolate reductase
MTPTQYYTATTLDGFIADPDDSLDWLFTRRREPGGPLDYETFIAGVGALAMGSTTYEWILEHGSGTWPYELPCWVFTHRELVAAAGEKNVWIVGGGALAGQFADAELLDEVLVTIAPVTLGAGAPLLPRRLELRLDELGQNGDFSAARFSVVRQSPAK